MTWLACCTAVIFVCWDWSDMSYECQKKTTTNQQPNANERSPFSLPLDVFLSSVSPSYFNLTGLKSFSFEYYPEMVSSQPAS